MVAFSLDAHAPQGQPVDPYDYVAPSYDEWDGPKVVLPGDGLLRDLTEHIMEAASHPVRELALASSIAFLAGIAGRSFHTYTGSKLTQYVVAVAGTARGKDCGPTVIRALVEEVERINPTITDYDGAGSIASGQALVKDLAERPSTYAFLGEFGLTLQRITAPNANMADKETKRVLLDTYTSTRLGRSIYSDKEKSTEAVRFPSFCFVGDTTPETYYISLDQERIEEGLVPRLLEFTYEGPRVRFNHNIGKAPSRGLVAGVAELVRRVALISHDGEHKYHRVQIDHEAKRLFGRLGNFSDYQINHGQDDTLSELWSRAALKVLRLASLLAVTELGSGWPKVMPCHVEWAQSIIWPSTERLIKRFEAGAVGNGESTFDSHIVKAMNSYFRTPPSQRVSSYGVPRAIENKENWIPFTYFRRVLQERKDFREHRLGQKGAIQLALDDAVRGELVGTKELNDLGLRSPASPASVAKIRSKTPIRLQRINRL